MKEITITPNQIKNAIEDLVNEKEMLQDKVYKLEDTIKEAIEYIDHCIFDYEENTMIGEDFKIVKRKLLGSDKEWVKKN